jgi:hypothetical protein
MNVPFDILHECSLPPGQLESEYASSFLILLIIIVAAVKTARKNHKNISNTASKEGPVTKKGLA